jgi:integrase
MKKLVRLWKRPTHDDQRYTYYLLYYDTDGRRRQKALGHADKRKAEKQAAQLEREVRMGTVEPGSMRLSEFLEDCKTRVLGQVRHNTLRDYDSNMRHFIEVVGNIDYQTVRHSHGERFIPACLQKGNSPATAKKKIKALKRLFQMAVERGDLESNPFQYIRLPKVAKSVIRVYDNDEIRRMLKIADTETGGSFAWGLCIRVALCTGMRKGEILNTTWRDIDFEKKTIKVSPKKDTQYTWQWEIKDHDRRVLPLTDEIIQLLVEHQAEQPEGYPYVFVPPKRYDFIQRVRPQGSWDDRKANAPVNNLRRQFLSILAKAGIENGTFHDLRRTCLTNWFANGLREYDVMQMAGHATFETTHKFYMGICDDLIDRTREASSQAMKSIFVAKLLQGDFEAPEGKSGVA